MVACRSFVRLPVRVVMQSVYIGFHEIELCDRESKLETQSLSAEDCHGVVTSLTFVLLPTAIVVTTHKQSQ